MGVLAILKKKATTVADLRAKLESLDQAAAEAAVAEAEAARKEALLGGDDATVDRAEAALTAARRELDRLLAAQEELTKRIPEMEVAERDADLAAKRAEIEKESAAVKKLLADRWPKVVSEAVGLLEQLDKVERRIGHFNGELHEIFGVQVTPVERLPSVEPALGFHVSRGDWWDGLSIRKNVCLPKVGADGPAWRA